MRRMQRLTICSETSRLRQLRKEPKRMLRLTISYSISNNRSIHGPLHQLYRQLPHRYWKSNPLRGCLKTAQHPHSMMILVMELKWKMTPSY